jgi:hypothetical protein
LHIWTEGQCGSNELHGWCFAVEEAEDADVMRPLFDSWAQTFEEIVRYPDNYAPREIVWRRVDTGEVVDIYSLQR